MTTSETRRARRSRIAATALVAGVVAAGVITAGSVGVASTSKRLVGTFKITKGTTVRGAVRGSYFRMVYPGGKVATGPFFANPNSRAVNKTFTLVAPGTAGGLRTGRFQPAPHVAFNAKGDSLARAIIAPTSFTGINFSALTASHDAQTGAKVTVPSITVSKGRLSGDLRAFNAAWNKLYFNQGSPKANGTRPGLTTKVTGTYNAKTRAYVLNWSSAIIGGPFNGFTGVWHLTGTFQAG
jgi:hypothetical protein